MGKLRAMLLKEVKANLAMVIMGAIAIISLTTTAITLIGQSRLKSLLEVQSVQIDQLIKTKKDWRFSQDVGSDNSLASIDELKMMVKELTKKIDYLPSSQVLGTGTTAYAGTVQVNSGASGSILSDPVQGASVVAEIPSGSIMFYTKKENNWYRVETTENVSGWISAELVSEIAQ